MKSMVLVAVSLLVLLAGCREGDSPQKTTAGTDDYLPLEKGNKWVWVGGVIPATGDTIAWEVKGKVVRETGKFAWNVRQSRHWEGKAKAGVDSINLAREDNVLLLYMDHVDPDADTLLNYPLTDGREWTVAHIVTRGVVRKSRVVGKEDVNTPYGQFDGALRVDSEERRVANDSLVTKMSDWYVPNVGRIRTRVEAREQIWEMTLLRTELH